MNVFLDTEFTSLEDSASLISIGLITQDGDRSFYAELSDTYAEDQCSKFVKAEVLPLLDAKPLVEPVSYKNITAQMTSAELTVHLNYWFAALIDPVQLWSDAPNHDWRYIKEIFKSTGLPFNLLVTPRSILGDDTSLDARYEASMERVYTQHQLKRHHALDDAKAIRMGWLTIH